MPKIVRGRGYESWKTVKLTEAQIDTLARPFLQLFRRVKSLDVERAAATDEETEKWKWIP